TGSGRAGEPAMTTETTHVHRRPGGAVFLEACSCVDPEAWPPLDELGEPVEVAAAPGTLNQPMPGPGWHPQPPLPAHAGRGGAARLGRRMARRAIARARRAVAGAGSFVGAAAIA